MLTRALKQAACRLFFFVIGTSVASAGSISVNPMLLTLSDSNQLGTVTLLNNGSNPMPMQLQIMSWSQSEGSDILTATREILANPPIFNIPAGGSQIIRLGLRRASDAQRELTYRIILQELPSPVKSDISGAQMLMRISMPVFVLPEVDAKAVLIWQADYTSKGTLKISAFNSGNAHIRISNFKLSLPGSSETLLKQEAGDYILAGQSKEWILSANADYASPPAGDTLQLLAQTNTGDIEAKVVIAP
ncbi:MAG TPA: phytochrome sensor protein [Rhodobacteraceae bacterium]|nr:phytochrome sensor protein [Paracoccaceae bacterium]